MDKITKICAPLTILVMIVVFLSLTSGIPIKNMLEGMLLAISFFFFLLGMLYEIKHKNHKDAYWHNFIALIFFAIAYLIEIFL